MKDGIESGLLSFNKYVSSPDKFLPGSFDEIGNGKGTWIIVEQLKPVSQLVRDNEHLVLIAAEGNQPLVEMKEIIAQLIQHKHFKIFKQK